jgi:REP element-mobilizing transposase RayT
VIQSVTYRLADSLPQARLAALREELARLPEAQREAERRRRIEAWLDAGMGCCALAHTQVARHVQESLLHFHGQRYHLHAWCVMPNHVHVLVEPLVGLARIVQGWKSFTAHWVLGKNEEFALGIPTSGQLWMREYWDRYIRDARHYQRAVEYIHQNPVKAGLCRTAQAWPWSSASYGSGTPGSAGVPAGTSRSQADGDVGAPR